jgi:hypothetical protein
MVNCTYKEPWKNKANSRRIGRGRECRPNKANRPKRGTEAVSGTRAGGVVVQANCAKQTQFAFG